MQPEDSGGPFEIRLAETAPLRGEVRFADHEPRPFEGWVALAAAVEAFVADERTRDAAARAA